MCYVVWQTFGRGLAFRGEKVPRAEHNLSAKDVLMTAWWQSVWKATCNVNLDGIALTQESNDLTISLAEMTIIFRLMTPSSVNNELCRKM